MSAAALSDDEQAIWSAVKRLSAQALAAVAHDIEAATGLSAGDFGILTRVADLGDDGRLSQAALLASLGWEKSRLSHQLTRMEARRLVARKRTGSRAVTVRLLPAGRDRVALARPVHANAVRDHILRHIDADEARTIIAIVERLSAA